MKNQSIQVAFLLVVIVQEGQIGYYRLVKNGPPSAHLVADFTATSVMTHEEITALHQSTLRFRKDDDEVTRITTRHVLKAIERAVREQLGDVVADTVRDNFADKGQHLGEVIMLHATTERPTTYVAVLEFQPGIMDFISDEDQKGFVALPLLCLKE